MCEIREHARHWTVMKRTLGMMMMNALISHNYTVSGRARLMNYVYGLNFAVNCDFFPSLSVRFVIKLQYTFICSNKSSPVGRVLLYQVLFVHHSVFIFFKSTKYVQFFFNMPALFIGKLSIGLCKCNVNQVQHNLLI